MANLKESPYVTEAREFLSRNGIEMKIVFRDREVNRIWNKSIYRNRYSVYIRNTNTGEVMRVIFWDSIHNTDHHITPSEYDVLACLTKYDPGTYEEFCSEYGYESKIENEFGLMRRNENVYKIYRGCRHEWQSVCRVFGDGEALEELREIS